MYDGTVFGRRLARNENEQQNLRVVRKVFRTTGHQCGRALWSPHVVGTPGKPRTVKAQSKMPEIELSGV